MTTRYDIIYNMKGKVKAIYIEGMERTGKTSIVRELRKLLKTNEYDFHELEGNGIDLIKKQYVITEDDSNLLILRQNGIIKKFHEEIKDGKSIVSFMEQNMEEIRLEKSYNHDFGSIMFLLIPSDEEAAKRIYGEEIPFNYLKLAKLYRDIGQTIFSQGLNIRPILIDKQDKIYDVRDKVLKVLEKDCFISLSS